MQCRKLKVKDPNPRRAAAKQPSGPGVGPHHSSRAAGELRPYEIKGTAMTVKFRAKGKGRARPKQHKGALTVEQWKQRKSGSKAGKQLTGAPTDFAGGKKG